MKYPQTIRGESAGIGISKIRVLADDLTGALDTAAMFVPVVKELAVSWVSPPTGSMGAAFDTETRNLTEHEAGKRLAGVSAWLCAAQLCYKKLDSQLRGPNAQEIAAVYQAGQFTSGVIAPAFPAQGRCTRNGRQWVRDPGAADWRAVGPDLVAQLKNLGLDVVKRSPASRAPPAVDHGALTLWDADTDDDLYDIAKAGLRITGRTLWCGSAGLAGALARCHGSAGKTSGAKILSSPLLFVIGTARPAMLRQINDLSEIKAVCRVRAGKNIKDARRELEEGLARSDIVLLTFALGQGLNERQAGEIIRQRMNYLFDSLPRPGSLFVSGGETLHGVLDILGAGEIIVDGEFEQGIAMGRMFGGLFNGIRLISKSGAFGTPDTLVRIARAAVSN